MVSCHDVRSLASPLWTVHAHDAGLVRVLQVRIAGLATPTRGFIRCAVLSRAAPSARAAHSPHVPGLMVTASVDKSVKVWDVLDAASAPTLVATKQMAVGQLFSAQFDAGAPFLLAVEARRVSSRLGNE